MVLWHGIPLYVPVACVCYCGSQGYTTSVHSFGSIVIRNESSVVKVWMYTRVDPSLSELQPSFRIFDPSACPFIR